MEFEKEYASMIKFFSSIPFCDQLIEWERWTRIAYIRTDQLIP